jgi:ribosome-associated protein
MKPNQTSASCGSDPGGQNVNKLLSAVQLRFDLAGSPSLPPNIKQRAARLAGRRLTRQGVLVIIAQRFRTQERNRADARERVSPRSCGKRPIRSQSVVQPRCPPRRDASGLPRRRDAASGRRKEARPLGRRNKRPRKSLLIAAAPLHP